MEMMTMICLFIVPVAVHGNKHVNLIWQ